MSLVYNWMTRKKFLEWDTRKNSVQGAKDGIVNTRQSSDVFNFMEQIHLYFKNKENPQLY